MYVVGGGSLTAHYHAITLCLSYKVIAAGEIEDPTFRLRSILDVQAVSSTLNRFTPD